MKRAGDFISALAGYINRLLDVEISEIGINVCDPY